MLYILVIIGGMLFHNTALGVEVFTAATGNFANKLEETDYGDSASTGGSIVAVGAFWPEFSALRVPLELRFQRVLQSTAWNDNKELGETQYRDGYKIWASEALFGFRWATFLPPLSASILFGGGRSEIEYKTRVNHQEAANQTVHSANTQHFTGQVDLRYSLPLEMDRVEFALIGMLRLSVLRPHTTSDAVPRTNGYLNLPNPIPSVGVSFGVKL